jgi:hypothetical protein
VHKGQKRTKAPDMGNQLPLLVGIINFVFKHTKLGNYSLKKSNSLISHALNTYFFYKKLLFKTLKECPGHSLTFLI